MTGAALPAVGTNSGMPAARRIARRGFVTDGGSLMKIPRRFFAKRVSCSRCAEQDTVFPPM
jgi:hypothetical protein